MKIIEIVDPRFNTLYCMTHLRKCKDYYFIETSRHSGFLIWTEGEIKIQHAISNKRMGRVKIKELNLYENKVRCVMGIYDTYNNNYLKLNIVDGDYWELSYSPSVSARVMDEITDLLSRVIIQKI